MKILKKLCLHNYVPYGSIVTKQIDYNGYSVYSIWCKCTKCGKEKIKKFW